MESSLLVRNVLGATLAATALSACMSIDSMRGRSSQPSSPPPSDPVASVPAESEWARSKRLFEEQFAAEYAEFRALEPRLRGGSTKAIADEADALRTRFVKRCIAESKLSSVSCWNATFARDITEELARIHKLTGDTVRAYLELDTLGYQPDLRSEKAQQDRSMGRTVWTEATDAARAEATALLPKLKGSRAELKSISRGKTTATLKFASNESASIEYDCGDEYVVVVADRTAPSGKKLATKQDCKVGSVRTQVEHYPTIVVSLEEARDLKVGQAVYAIAAKKGRSGHVMSVWRDKYSEDKDQLSYRSLPIKDGSTGYL